MPVMLIVIALASRWISHLAKSRNTLATGMLALVFMVVAELAVAALTGGGSPIQYIAAKDPVSGAAYLASLVIFSLAPWAWTKKLNA